MMLILNQVAATVVPIIDEAIETSPSDNGIETGFDIYI
jgi:hypothetical protein